METQTEYPDPEKLTPAERIDYIQAMRRQVLADDSKVSDEDLRYAIDILRVDRSLGGGGKKEPKPVVKPLSLDAF